jgi:hypothetical protein
MAYQAQVEEAASSWIHANHMPHEFTFCFSRLPPICNRKTTQKLSCDYVTRGRNGSKPDTNICFWQLSDKSLVVAASFGGYKRPIAMSSDISLDIAKEAPTNSAG